MAKFNLKNIMSKDYGLDYKDATNFSEFVCRTLKLRAELGEDYKEILIIDSSTNKKDFIKSLINKMERFRNITPQNHRSTLDMMSEVEEKPNPVYEENRLLKLELEEVKNKNINLIKKLETAMGAENEMFKELSSNLEVSSKVISEFNHYICEFPELSKSFKSIRAAYGRASFAKRDRLKNLLVDQGLNESEADFVLNKYTQESIEIFNKERCENVEFDSSEEKIRESRDLFKFVMNNKDFILACKNLKESHEVSTLGLVKQEETPLEKELRSMLALKSETLKDLGTVFISGVVDKRPKYVAFNTAALEIFGNSVKNEICEAIGIDCIFHSRNTYIKKNELSLFVKKFNDYAIERLSGGK